MCTGRVDLAFIIRAFNNGMDGVFIGGCWPGECHYLTEGNYLAFSTVNICKKLLEYTGINPGRLRIEWMSAAEGSRFAGLMNDFSKRLKLMGPITGDTDGYEARFETVNKLIPYIKLVERERFRLPVKSEKAYDDFYKSEEFERLFRELILDRLCLTEITDLLREKPRSSEEIAEVMGISPYEVSKYMNSASGYGLIDYIDQHYTIAMNVCSQRQK